jgi:hypothetical protein
MKQVYQVIDGDQVVAQVPMTCTAVRSGKQYNVLSRMRADGVPTAEFYVIQDHWTKIIPVLVAQVQQLSANAKIIPTSVDDTTVDDAIHPPIE